MKKQKLERLIQSKGPNAIFFGDWHGDLEYALNSIDRAIEKFPHIKVFYHAGDFGLGLSPKHYLDSVAVALKDSERVMLVTGGNHEDWNLWDAMIASSDGAPYHYDNSGLIFLPKKYNWRHSNRRFLSVGGASSIDQYYREINRDWWSQEEISFEVVEEVLADESLLEVDVLITHESSDNPVMPIAKRLNDFLIQSQYPPELLKISETQRQYISSIIDKIKPKTHVHGHWHLPYAEKLEGVMTYSLGDNSSSHAENSVIL